MAWDAAYADLKELFTLQAEEDGRPLRLPDAGAFAAEMARLSPASPPKLPEPVRLSVAAPEVEPAEVGADDVADPIVEEILRTTTEALNDGTAEAVAELRAVMSRAEAPEMQLFLARRFVDRHTPHLASLLTEVRLAAVLAGMLKVAKRLPEANPTGSAITLPASLTPDQAGYLLDELIKLPEQKLAEQLSDLPDDQAAYFRAVARERERPPEPPWDYRTDMGEELPEPAVRFPIIDEAVEDLRNRQLLTREEFDQLADDAKRYAFTVAGVESTATLDKIRKSLADQVEKGADLKEFGKTVAESVGEGTFLSPAHMETVFRTNVQSAYSAGNDKVLDHPAVSDGFPYEMTVPIQDDRLTELCAVVSRSGLHGTGIFRRDDPQWVKFKPPRHFNCRCGRVPLSVRQAASRGVQEAQKWLETGIPPAVPAWVDPIPVESPPGWQRQ